jgi:hypothetical protein
MVKMHLVALLLVEWQQDSSLKKQFLRKMAAVPVLDPLPVLQMQALVAAVV